MSAGGDGVIVGRHAVAEALARRPESARELLLAGNMRAAAMRDLETAARRAGVKVRRVERDALNQLAGTANHQGAVLTLAAVEYAPFGAIISSARQAGPSGLVVLADHLQDPHNLGALIRSAAAAGAQGVVVPKDRSCPLTPAVAKAAAGALSILPVARVTNLTQALEELKEAGLWALAAATREAPPPWSHDLDRPLALVVGGEHAGVGQRLLAACDLAASLPLAAGVESLNASVAAGVLLFEVVRQRALAGDAAKGPA